jgi:DNA mismatch endonuclease (patch repair protein)
MSSIHATSTKPELKLRSELWRRGYRYRINDKRFAGSPDIVLPKYRTAIFVHGCFWHGHKGCPRYVVPKTNTEFWINKIARNQKRDEDVWRQLEAKGWSVVIVWECELGRNVLESTIDRVEKEILANREAYRRTIEERRRIQRQHSIECQEQKSRHHLLISEIKRK